MLTWQDNSSNETLFYVERCEGAGCSNFASLASQWADSPSYTDYSALSGLTYQVPCPRLQLRWRTRPYSNIASVLAGGSDELAAPGNLTATALTRSSIGLAWTNGTTSQTEVRIERCRGTGCTNFAQVAVLAGTATSFTDKGLAAWTTYRYRVRAHNALGDSAYSNTASARTKR